MSFSRAAKRRTKKHYGVASLQDAEKILEAGKIVDDQLHQTVKTTFQDALPRVRAEVMPTVIANMLGESMDYARGLWVWPQKTQELFRLSVQGPGLFTGAG